MIGPRKAIVRLNMQARTPEERAQWLEDARIMAVLGPCAKTLASVRSEVRCFMAFAGTLFLHVFPLLPSGRFLHDLGAHLSVEGEADIKSCFPPTVELLAAWAACFRCAGTFQNYVGHVRTFCLALNVSVEVVHCLSYFVSRSVSHSYQVFEHPLIARAKLSVKAIGGHQTREKRFIQRCISIFASKPCCLGSLQ